MISPTFSQHEHTGYAIPYQSINSVTELFGMLDSEIMDDIKNEALIKLNSHDFHRQLRNELIMIPIPNILSNEYNENEPLSQGHYLEMTLEQVCLG